VRLALPNQTVEPTGAPRWDLHAPSDSMITGFGGRQARAPVAHFSRSAQGFIRRHSAI
jgi:hypothetical protein